MPSNPTAHIGDVACQEILDVLADIEDNGVVGHTERWQDAQAHEQLALLCGVCRNLLFAIRLLQYERERQKHAD